MGLGHVTHLTRPEWGLVRSVFGAPRRLSLAFLKEERSKLEVYRWVRSMHAVTVFAFCWEDVVFQRSRLQTSVLLLHSTLVYITHN